MVLVKRKSLEKLQSINENRTGILVLLQSETVYYLLYVVRFLCAPMEKGNGLQRKRGLRRINHITYLHIYPYIILYICIFTPCILPRNDCILARDDAIPFIIIMMVIRN